MKKLICLLSLPLVLAFMTACTPDPTFYGVDPSDQPSIPANHFVLERVHGSWITSSVYKSGYNVFQSSGSWHVANSYDLLKVSFRGPASFTVYYGSYAESSYDFVCIGALDGQGATWNSSNYDGSWTSSGSQSSAAPNLSRSYSVSDKNVHYFYVMYKKDGSQDTNNDRGYLALPTSFSYVWK